MSTLVKRVLSALILAALLVSSLTIPSLAPTAHAGSDAALQYARLHWSWIWWDHSIDNGSTDVVEENWQDDFACAEFVARSLAAAGLFANYTSGTPQKYYGGVIYNNHSYNLKIVTDLYNLLITSGLGTEIGSTPSSANAGDVAFYGVVENYNNHQHVVLVTSQHANGRYYTTGHNQAINDSRPIDGYDLPLTHIVRINYAHSTIATSLASEGPILLRPPAPYRGHIVTRDVLNPDLEITWNPVVTASGYHVKVWNVKGDLIKDTYVLGSFESRYKLRLYGTLAYGVYNYEVGMMNDNPLNLVAADTFNFEPGSCLLTPLSASCGTFSGGASGSGGSEPPPPPPAPNEGVRICSGTGYSGSCGDFTYTSSSTCIYLGNVAGHNKAVDFRGSYEWNYDAVMYHNPDCSSYTARYDHDVSDIGWGLYDQFYSMRLEQHQVDGVRIYSETNMSGTSATFQYPGSGGTCIGLGAAAGHNKSIDFLGIYEWNYDAVMYHNTDCSSYTARYDHDVSDIGWGLYNQFYSMRLERHSGPGILTLIQPSNIWISTVNPQVGQVITARFGVQNIGESDLVIQNLTAAARYGTTWNAPVVDFPGVLNITLHPGDTYFYDKQQSFSQAGTYFTRPMAQINGAWAPVPGSYQINYDVSNPPTPTQGNQYSTAFYENALPAGWENWSWDSTLSFADTSRPFSAPNAILWTSTAAYAGLYLHSPTLIDTSGYGYLRFALKATQSGGYLAVSLIDEANTTTGSVIHLEYYGGQPLVDHYKVYQIQLSAFGAVNKKISGLQFQDLSGAVRPPLLIDHLGLLGGNGDAAVTLPGNTFLAYNDWMASGWESWPWDSSVGWYGPAYSGEHSLVWTPNAGWAGHDFHCLNGISTTPYTTLHFTMKATSPGTQIAVFLDDANGTPIKSAIPLAHYGGDPVTGWWQVYDIPLADLGGSGTTIKGIVFMNNSNNATTDVYIDEVGMY